MNTKKTMMTDPPGIAVIIIVLEYSAVKLACFVGAREGFMPKEMANTISLVGMMIAILLICWLGTLPVPEPTNLFSGKRKK